MLPNAPLNSGPNAYGILQHEFDSLGDKYPELARVLKYGVAYNVFALVPGHQCKRREWCLIQLSGIVCLHYGLTLRFGGFVEGSATELAAIARGASA
jgi:hypothetical protein